MVEIVYSTFSTGNVKNITLQPFSDCDTATTKWNYSRLVAFVSLRDIPYFMFTLASVMSLVLLVVFFFYYSDEKRLDDKIKPRLRRGSITVPSESTGTARPILVIAWHWRQLGLSWKFQLLFPHNLDVLNNFEYGTICLSPAIFSSDQKILNHVIGVSCCPGVPG